MSPMTRQFPTNVVISILTGKLICELGELYEVASFLVGRSVYTHELPAVVQLAAPHIVAQHPQLDGVDTSGVNRETWRSEVKRFAEQFGCSLSLTPIGWNALADKSPLETAVELVGEERVIAVDL